MKRRLAALLLSALQATAAAAAPRVIAIGDVHGALDNFQAILREAGLIDADRRWTGGTSVLVQTGDYTDRGADVRQVMELLMALEPQAAAAGGRVHVLLGNHEGMNLLGAFRDVGPEAYTRFVDPRSEKLRTATFKELKQLLRRRSSDLGLPAPTFAPDAKEGWMATHPPGLIEYQLALGPEGELGAWLRRRATTLQVGDSVFVHGGLNPELAALPLEEINRRVWREIETLDGDRRTLIDEGVILPYFDFAETAVALREYVSLAEAAHEAHPSEALAGRIERLSAIQAELGKVSEEWLLIQPEGPLWFRGYAHWPDEALAPLVEPMLERLGARRIVAGHSTLADGTIETRLGGRVQLIDTGMLGGEYYPMGRASALEIDGERVRPLYAAGVMEPAGALLPPALLPETESPARAGRFPAADGGSLPFADDDAVLEFLRTAPIVDSQPIGEGVTRPLRLTLSDGGVTVHAVHHNHDIERPGVRRSGRGVIRDFRDSYRAQIAGYEVARLLGLDNVPPAALRKVEGVPSSLALWIEGGLNERRLRTRGEKPPDALDYARRLADARVFDNLIHNIDRNQTNIVIDELGKIWLIDHTRAFGSSPLLPSPELVTRCSRALWGAIQSLERGTAEPRLRPVLGEAEIGAMFKRRQHLVDLLQHKIDELGEDQVLFRHGSLDDKVRVLPLPETQG